MTKNTLHIALFSTFVLAMPASAIAQPKEFVPGINTVKLYNGPVKAKEPEQPKKPAVVRPDINQRNEEEAKKKLEDIEKKETAAQRVWNKYKDLASGLEGKEEESVKTEDTASKDEKKEDGSTKSENTAKQENEKAEAQEEVEPSVGLESLLQNYQRNKEQQSQMKTRTLSIPKNKKNNE